jgi:hypothetical protein
MNTNNQPRETTMSNPIDLPFNGYSNLYQAMCVYHDFMNKEEMPIYKAEELALEVV